MADAATATATTTTTTTAAPWYSGVPDITEEMVGHWKNAGWDGKKPEEIAIQATKSWKAAERHVGVPADQILRVPKDLKDEAGWKQVWSKLGKPEKPDDYDFSAIKFSDGTDLDGDFVAQARTWAYQFNLPKDAATGMVQQFAKFLDGAETTDKAERDAKLIEQKAALKKNWGPNEAANMFVAQRTATALGVSPETVAALESVIGYDKIMEMFRDIGTKIGEDKFVKSSAPGGGGGPMTREQAMARIEDLKSDPVWAKAYMDGDKQKLREMMALQSIVTGISANA